MTFATYHNTVHWQTEAGCVRLTPEMCEGLLDVLEAAEDPAAHKLFNQLHDAHREAGGIERITSWRKVA